MANRKISELQSRTPALSDLMLVGDPSSGYSYKCTVTALATIIETDIADGYVTIGTTQTISGAKTFSNNLTLTSVANATTTQTKFLTLNGSNVVNYRTGAEVLADIGGVGGSGTTNYLSKFSATTTLANSQIFDNGTNIGIGTATPDATARVQINKTDGYGLFLNYTTNTGTAPTAVALWALNTTLTGGYAAIIEERTPVNNGGQYPFSIKHSLSSGTAQVGMGTGVHFQLPDDAGTFKTTQLTIETIDAAAATYKTRYRFNVQNNGSSTPIAYINATGLGVFTASPSVALDVTGEGKFSTINNATTDTDRFLVSDGGLLKYRTGTQILSDIGGADDTLVLHKAGDETITGIKTFTPRAKFDAGINLKQGSGASLDTGYSAISADATTFYFHRATSIAALSVNNLTATRTYTLQDANGTLAFLSDITSALTGYVPTSRTLIINGVGFDLSANRTWNVGTVTSVGLSTGTTGTDISVSGSPITSSGTITLNIPTASATNRGALSSTDWTTFNNKQNALTLTTTGSSGAATLVGSTLNIPQYQAALTNPVTGTGTTNYIPKFTSSSAIGNSQIFDNGTNVGIGTSSPSTLLTLNASNVSNRGQLSIQATDFAQITLYKGTTTTTDLVGQLYAEASTSNLILQNFQAAPLIFGTSATERMRLTSGGNLLLGTTGDIGVKLSVSDGTVFTGFLPFAAGSAAITGTWSNHAFVTYTNGTERMRLTSGGSLGIGTSSPSVKLDVIESGTPTTASAGTVARFVTAGGGGYDALIGIVGGNGGRSMIDLGDTDASSVGRLGYDHTTNFMFFQTNGSERMRLDASGNLLVGKTSTSFSSAGTIIYPSSGVDIIRDGNPPIALNRLTSEGRIIDLYVASAIVGSIGGLSGTGLTFNTGTTERMRLDASGNLGLGVTPSAWASFTGLQVGETGSFASNDFGSGNIQTFIGNNVYYDAAGFKYIQAGSARMLRMTSDNFNWEIAGSGSANGAISFTQAMTLDASGRLGIGTTSPAHTLDVVGNGRFTQNQNGITSVRVQNNNLTIGAGQAYRFDYDNSVTLGGIFSEYASSGAYDIRISTWSGFAPVSRFFINGSNGNVGIGTTSPAQKLSVYDGAVAYQSSAAGGAEIWRLAIGSTSQFVMNLGGTTGILYSTVSDTSKGQLAIRDGLSDLYPAYSFINDGDTGISNAGGTANTLNFITGASERMRITSGGELLIGTTSDAGDYKLQVNGVGYFTGSGTTTGIYINNSTASNYSIITLNNSGASGRNIDIGLGGNTSAQPNSFYIYDNTASATRMTINSSGNTEFFGSIKTAAPSGGTAQPWKLGSKVTQGGILSLDVSNYIQVEINGTVWKLGVVN